MRNGDTITAYIGLGANQGDRAANLYNALARLSATPGVTIGQISKLIDTPAVGGPEGSPPFLNGAVSVETTLGSHALMKVLTDIEKDLGRVRRVKWEPRMIDLDLLLYGQEIISSDDLIVPHPLMHERTFVLQPMAEIAPKVVHPTIQMSIEGLLDSLREAR
ncbi:2-amino-4-hydroxy-6-hydroxymethyldihydropteridinediphosphokinase [soil metagenome]